MITADKDGTNLYVNDKLIGAGKEQNLEVMLLRIYQHQ